MGPQDTVKRGFGCLALVGLALGLAACGGNDDVAVPPTPPVVDDPTPPPPPVAGQADLGPTFNAAFAQGPFAEPVDVSPGDAGEVDPALEPFDVENHEDDTGT